MTIREQLIQEKNKESKARIKSNNKKSNDKQNNEIPDGVSIIRSHRSSCGLNSERQWHNPANQSLI